MSTSLQCGTVRCATDEIELSTPVQITIRHSNAAKVCVCVHSIMTNTYIINFARNFVQRRIRNDPNATTLCVFWDIEIEERFVSLLLVL